MLEWTFLLSGWMVAIAGIVIAWWLGWRDTGKGTRRCAGCWYDMRSTSNLKCPECGREAKAERSLFRVRRQWKWIAVGFLVSACAYPLWKWPLYQRGGWKGFIPRTLTIWLLPELPRSWEIVATPPPGKSALLLDELCRMQPLDKVERYALAHAIRRVLRDPNRYSRQVQFLWLWQRRLGNEAMDLASELAQALLRGEQLPVLVFLAEQLPPLVDARAFGMVKPLVQGVLDGVTRPSQSNEFLGRLKLWGACDDDLRAVAFSLIDHNEPGQLPDSREVEFLWRENLIRPEDADRVQRWAKTEVWPFATYATFLACEVPQSLPLLVPHLEDKMKVDGLQEISDWLCLAVAMQDCATPLRPAFERIGKNKTFPSFVASSEIAIQAMTYRPSEAYRTWWTSLQRATNHDPQNFVQRYKIAPAVLYLHMPVKIKVEGLCEVLRLERLDMNGPGVSSTVLIAIDSLGKLGSEARGSLKQLCALIDPGVPSFLVESVLRAIAKFGPLSDSEWSDIEQAVEVWGRSTVYAGNAPHYLQNLRAARTK